MPFEVNLTPRMCDRSCVMQTQCFSLNLCLSCFGFGHKNRILLDTGSVTSLLDSVTFGQTSHHTLVSVHNKGGCSVNSSWIHKHFLLCKSFSYLRRISNLMTKSWNSHYFPDSTAICRPAAITLQSLMTQLLSKTSRRTM